MQIRYRYRLKPEIERKIREARKVELERSMRFIKPGEYSPEDLKIWEEVNLHIMPGVDPDSLIELAQKIKDRKLREGVIESIKLYYQGCIPVSGKWVEGAPDFASYPP
ncbi:MAG TPA: hypothetical protein ENJ40_00160 [Thermosulfurimonas dismutans]|uniref:Uncharacterized protein n=1 Tax=Thermosulfurimonas dismutans TaxID=999894 RepID=A0A7C3GCM2_9BACT|nr:hypothetical protein [Thermosulfurimonas dismutans]